MIVYVIVYTYSKFYVNWQKTIKDTSKNIKINQF